MLIYRDWQDRAEPKVRGLEESPGKTFDLFNRNRLQYFNGKTFASGWAIIQAAGSGLAS